MPPQGCSAHLVTSGWMGLLRSLHLRAWVPKDSGRVPTALRCLRHAPDSILHMSSRFRLGPGPGSLVALRLLPLRTLWLQEAPSPAETSGAGTEASHVEAGSLGPWRGSEADGNCQGAGSALSSTPVPSALCWTATLLGPGGATPNPMNGLRGAQGFPGDRKWGPRAGPQVCFHQCSQGSGLC